MILIYNRDNIYRVREFMHKKVKECDSSARNVFKNSYNKRNIVHSCRIQKFRYVETYFLVVFIFR
jgi:hypothetical protein